MKDILILAEEIAEILLRLNDTACVLLQYASSKEAALLSDNLDELKLIIEQEEDAIIDFKLCEKKRTEKTEKLISALGIGEKRLSLKQISSIIGDESVEKQLTDAGNRLAESILSLKDKNEALSEIVYFKSEFVGAMLELLTGCNLEKSRNYTANGGLESQPEPGAGMLEILA